MPEQVVIGLAEIAESAKEGLLALSVGVGLQVMAGLFEADVTGLCGPRGRHNRQRVGYRHASGGRVGEPGRVGFNFIWPLSRHDASGEICL